MTHSSIQWQDRAHFDWKRFGELSLADGITSSNVADFSGRLLRLDFIRTVLTRAGFQVEVTGDLLDARIAGLQASETEGRLQTLGRVLGTTRLMDMTLHEVEDVGRCVETFLAAGE